MTTPFLDELETGPIEWPPRWFTCNRCGRQLKGITNFHIKYETTNSNGQPRTAIDTLVCCEACRKEITEFIECQRGVLVMVTKDDVSKAVDDIGVKFNVVILAVMRHGADKVVQRLKARGVTEEQIQKTLTETNNFVKGLFEGLDDDG